jgi:hypothetical protein
MKTILLFVSLSVNILLVLIACSKNDSGNNTVPGSPSANNLTRGGGASASVVGSSTCPGPQPAMTYTTVAQMVQNYVNNQWTIINNAMGFQDARAAHFELDSLQGFICHLKAQVAQSGCAQLADLGVRFYYGAYAAPPGPGVPSAYARKHTLIMIPTYKNAQGIYVDFDPAYINPVTCMPVPLNELGRSTPANNILMNSGTVTIFAKDHPSLPPPPVAGTAF